MSFNLRNFIPYKSKEQKKKDTKKKTTNETYKELALRNFESEMNKINTSLFQINDQDRNNFKDDLVRILDFEEGNMKLFLYCFLLLRNYNYNYNLLLEDYSNLKRTFLEIFKLFINNENQENKFLYFVIDIYTTCKVILLNRHSEKKYEYNTRTDFFAEDEIEKRQDLFDFF